MQARQLAVVALLLGFTALAQRPGAFLPPLHYVNFGVAASPAELAKLEPVIAAVLRSEGPSGGVQPRANQAQVETVELGRLGRAFWVVPIGGPMGSVLGKCFLLVRQNTSFRIVLKIEGQIAVLPARGSVPDLAVRAVGERQVQLYRYQHGTYSAADTSRTRQAWLQMSGLTMADYVAARAALRSDPAAVRGWRNARGVWTSPNSAVVKTGDCDRLGNCAISTFITKRARRGPLHPVATGVRGIGVAGDSTDLVVAQSLGKGRDEFISWGRKVGGWRWPDVGPLVKKACEVGQGDVTTAVFCKTGAPVPDTAIPFDPMTMRSAAQDRDGTVWGVSAWHPQRVWQWRKGRWRGAGPPKSLSLERRQTANALDIWPTAEGGVAVLWSLWFPPEWVLARGQQVWAHSLAGNSAPAVLLADGTSPLLVKEDLHRSDVPGPSGPPQLQRWMADGTTRGVYQFAPGQFYPLRSPVVGRTAYAALAAMRDVEGQVWIWTTNSGEKLRGLVIGRQDQFHWVNPIPGLPDVAIARLWPWDAAHVAAWIPEHGLYLINIHSLRGQAMPEPGVKASAEVADVFGEDNAHFVVTVAGPDEKQLWERWQGRWWLRVGYLTSPSDLNRVTPNLISRGGVWVGTDDEGLWYVADDPHRPAAHIGWRQQLPIAAVRQIFSQPGGRILVLGRNAGATEVTTKRMLAPPAMSHKIIGVVTFPAPLWSDHGQIQGIRNGKLWTWTGSRWQTSPAAGRQAPAMTLGRENRPGTAAYCALEANPGWVIADTQGDDWWTDDERVLEGNGRQCWVILPANEPQPFDNGTGIWGVLRDDHGHAFLWSKYAGAFHYTIVNAH